MDEKFTLNSYKVQLGRPYSRIQLFLCPKEDWIGLDLAIPDKEHDEAVANVNDEENIGSKESEEEEDDLPGGLSDLPDLPDIQAPVRRPRLSLRLRPHQRRGRFVELPAASDRDSSAHGAQEDPYTNYVNLLDEGNEGDDDEEAQIQAAIAASLQDSVQIHQNRADATLQALIGDYMHSNFGGGEEIVTVVINRKRLLRTTLRAINEPGFSFTKRVHVVFAGEDGEDFGGPRREFFRKLMKAVSDRIFEGVAGSMVFQHDIKKLEDKTFYTMGQLLSWSIGHGGPGLPVIAEPLYLLMTGQSVQLDTATGLITDPDYLTRVEKITKCTDIKDLDGDLTDWLIDNGVDPRQKKGDVLDQIVRKYIWYRTYAEAMQFSQGINSLGGLWDTILRASDVLKPVLVDSANPLNLETFRRMLTVNYSDGGSNLKKEEDDTWYCWEVYLQRCSEGRTKTDLPTLLAHWTGADRIPPLGFDGHLTVEFFSTGGVKRLPTVSTCAMVLSLPRGMEDEDEFMEMMDKAIQESGGFHAV